LPVGIINPSREGGVHEDPRSVQAARVRRFFFQSYLVGDGQEALEEEAASVAFSKPRLSRID